MFNSDDDPTDPIIWDTKQEKTTFGITDALGWFLKDEKRTNFQKVREHLRLSYVLVQHAVTKETRWIDQYKIKNHPIDELFFDADPKYTPDAYE